MCLSLLQLHSSLTLCSLWLPRTQCWAFWHRSSEGSSPGMCWHWGRCSGGSTPGLGPWCRVSRVQGHSAKIKLIPVLLDALAAPTALTSQRVSWPSPEVGRRWETWWQSPGLKLGSGGSIGHGDCLWRVVQLWDRSPGQDISVGGLGLGWLSCSVGRGCWTSTSNDHLHHHCSCTWPMPW